MDEIQDIKRRAGITEAGYTDNDAVFQAIDLIDVLRVHLKGLPDYDFRRFEQDLQFRDLDIERIKQGLAAVGQRMSKERT